MKLVLTAVLAAGSITSIGQFAHSSLLPSTQEMDAIRKNKITQITCFSVDFDGVTSSVVPVELIEFEDNGNIRRREWTDSATGTRIETNYSYSNGHITKESTTVYADGFNNGSMRSFGWDGDELVEVISEDPMMGITMKSELQYDLDGFLAKRINYVSTPLLDDNGNEISQGWEETSYELYVYNSKGQLVEVKGYETTTSNGEPGGLAYVQQYQYNDQGLVSLFTSFDETMVNKLSEIQYYYLDNGLMVSQEVHTYWDEHTSRYSYQHCESCPQTWKK
jgi:hypothetical protein